LLDGRLAAIGTVETMVGRPMEEKADFWTAVGGQYKPSIDYALRLSIPSGAAYVRGPEVRTQTVRTKSREGPPGTMVELYRFGGTIRNTDAEPVSDVWVAMPESGTWTSSDRAGRFIFDRVRPGIHRVLARTADGAEVAATISVPGERADLVIGPAKRASKRDRTDA
jgi:hypothetical protein